tara:strand:+ start:218 stop:517 length:300 start_codon:yes stop_codon:yes gene_type:complete
MPIYEFRNKDTGEIWEEFLTMSGKDEYLVANPHAQLVIGAPAIISGIAGVTHKTDGGFNDLLNRIGNANPTSPLAQQYGDKSIKASKTRDAVNKAKNKK